MKIQLRDIIPPPNKCPRINSPPPIPSRILTAQLPDFAFFHCVSDEIHPCYLRLKLRVKRNTVQVQSRSQQLRQNRRNGVKTIQKTLSGLCMPQHSFIESLHKAWRGACPNGSRSKAV